MTVRAQPLPSDRRQRRAARPFDSDLYAATLLLMTSILRVALAVPLPRCFDYLMPDGDVADDWVGVRVRVPFGKRELIGVVCAVDTAVNDTRDLRQALARLDAAPIFSVELLATLTWASTYYAHPLGEVLGTALPVALRKVRGTKLPQSRWYALTDEGQAALTSKQPRSGSVGRQILEALLEGGLSAAGLAERVPKYGAPLRRLTAKGLVVDSSMPSQLPRHARAGPALNSQQRAVVDAVTHADGRFAAVLLDGVTGSGKTEVYLTVVARQLALGRQALILVPEIGLTPQALQRYRERLGVPVAAMHSGLADGERAATWLAAGRGEVSVIVGTRSAIMTPLLRPGVIVVDEEHDGSYKQQDGFRYSARDLAVVRARALNIPVILGSATPSLETLANASAGRYQHLRLTQRAGAANTPSVQLVDLRGQRLHEGMSNALLTAIGACVARGEQALVFRNRRGFSPVLMCHGCGWHGDCPRCDRALTLHRGARELRCHHCGHSERMPTSCPNCSAAELMPVGAGTERLEAALAERFPDVPVLRIDRDSTRRKQSFEQMLAELEQGKPAILVGTQMLAKGHDLPNLTLSALVDVDQGLFSTDFRGAERLAQLVIQVAGRAGRDLKPGLVILQTHQPEHSLLTRLLAGGYRAFALSELAEREALGFPPYAHLALLRAEAVVSERVFEFLDAAAALLQASPHIGVRGPLPAPMAKRAGLMRGQLLLESTQRAALHAALAQWVPQLYALREGRRVRWSLDVDPMDLY